MVRWRHYRAVSGGSGGGFQSAAVPCRQFTRFEFHAASHWDTRATKSRQGLPSGRPLRLTALGVRSNIYRRTPRNRGFWVMFST